jgi:diguanylate cyclase (GGDEF)-like protein
MPYKIPGTEGDPPIPAEIVEMAADLTGLDSEHPAVAYISHLALQRDILVEQADRYMIDEKTGVLKEEAFRRLLNNAIAGMKLGHRRQDKANAVMFHFLDVYEFKKINAEFGHPGGDLRLKATGQALKQVVRIEGMDLVGRVGGDEFATAVFYDRYEISDSDMLEQLEDRLSNPLLFEMFEHLPVLRWNHAVFTGTEDIDDLFRAADVKGKNWDEGLVRLNNQTHQERMAALEAALTKYPLLK